MMAVPEWLPSPSCVFLGFDGLVIELQWMVAGPHPSVDTAHERALHCQPAADGGGHGGLLLRVPPQGLALPGQAGSPHGCHLPAQLLLFEMHGS